MTFSQNYHATRNYVNNRLCLLLNRPFRSFFSTFHMDILGKISRHHWKEHLKISKTVTFESDASDDIAQQSCENLQTFVWWEGGWGNLCKMSRLGGTISS